MSTYHVRLPHGETIPVEMPEALRLKVPMSDAQARQAMTRYLTQRATEQLAPHVKPRPEWNEIVRDEQGSITATLKHPPDPPAAETAAELGRQVAEAYLAGADWDE